MPQRLMKGSVMPMFNLFFAIALLLMFSPVIRVLYYTLFFYWIPLAIMRILVPFYKTDFCYSKRKGVLAIGRPEGSKYLAANVDYNEFVYGEANILKAYIDGCKIISQAEKESKDGNNKN